MNNPSLPTDASNTSLIQDESSISIVDLIENFFYFRWHFIVTGVLCTLVALIYAILATPIFVADSLIQIDRKTGGSFSAFAQAGAGSPSSLGAAQSPPIFAEIEIIKSRYVIGKAVESLQANISVTVANRLPLIGGWLSRVLSKDADGLV